MNSIYNIVNSNIKIVSKLDFNKNNINKTFFNMTSKYDDIINLTHHISKKHKQMSLSNRAAQFAPFSALTGYEDNLKETQRITSERLEIDESFKEIINEKIKQIQDKIKNMPKVIINYFIPDLKKTGGKYQKIIGNVKKIDLYNQAIVMIDETKININEIIDIDFYF